MDEFLFTALCLAGAAGCVVAFLVVVGRAGIEADKRRAAGYADGKADRPPESGERAYIEGYMRGRGDLEREAST